MRVLTLWQPWASAIDAYLKTFETRSWWTNYRGAIAIHAAKRSVDFDCLHSLRSNDKCVEAFRSAGIDLLGNPDKEFPRGVIVTTATLVDCLPVEQLHHELIDIERMLGNYEAGRYGWRLANITRVNPPIPYLGSQGMPRLRHAAKCSHWKYANERFLTPEKEIVPPEFGPCDCGIKPLFAAEDTV